jgi:sugar phosphate isomerase/epimerase
VTREPVRAVNDGTSGAPRLRLDLNLGTLLHLPAHATGPKKGDDTYAAIVAAGYEGVQGGEVAPARAAGLAVSSMGRVDRPDDAFNFAKLWAEDGVDCGTVHVGSGYEDDDEIDSLVRACVEASAEHAVPVYVELHRATITQDPWRTLRLIDRTPEVRFNADLSHWYTGGEMPYGDFGKRVDALQPVFERVRFVHGRVSSSGQIQAVVEALGGEEPSHVQHFRELWTRCFAGFLSAAGPGDVLPFAVELLPSSITYALVDDHGVERGDRWLQAKVHCDLARECWAAAAAT